MKLARVVVLLVLLLSVPVATAAPKSTEAAGNGLIVYALWEESVGDPGNLARRLYTVDPQGGEPTRLTQGLDSEWNARWSPDGTQILFLRVSRSIDPDTGDLRIGSNHLFVAQADGSDPRQLSTGDRSVHEAEWSPDGQRIAFTRAYKPGASRRDLYVINADGSNLLRLTNNRNWKQPKVRRNSVAVLSWSPTGRAIAFLPGYEGLRGNGVFTVHSDGSRDPKRVLSGVYVSNLDWSPIDGRLALAVHGSCARNADLNEGGVGILNLRTGKVAVSRSRRNRWSGHPTPNGSRMSGTTAVFTALRFEWYVPPGSKTTRFRATPSRATGIPHSPSGHRTETRSPSRSQIGRTSARRSCELAPPREALTAWLSNSNVANTSTISIGSRPSNRSLLILCHFLVRTRRQGGPAELRQREVGRRPRR